MTKWYTEKGRENDVVLNTSVNLMRNLDEYPFPEKLTKEKMEKVNGIIKDIIFSDNAYALSCVDVAALTPSQTVSLAERYLISAEFASNTIGRGLLLSENESISVMLCEEDHVKIQSICSGLDFDKTYDTVSRIDSLIDDNAVYAFDERLGYLTQNPANLGTGMRASVTLHLPALSAAGNMNRLAQTVSKLGLTLRSCYLSGTTPVGSIYRLSNQVTLGISEKAALSNLSSIALQLASQERQTRELVIKDDRYIDKIWRSYGILQNAYLLKSKEFMELISFVRLGSACGILDVGLQKIYELMIDMQPATLNAFEGRELSVQERDALRAKSVKEKLKAN